VRFDHRNGREGGIVSEAVVLLSGGLDSATALAIAQAHGHNCHCLSFDYGQRHKYELECARRVAGAAGVTDHRIAAIDLRTFGGSALTDDRIAVPAGRAPSDMAVEIPVTYVPARNTIFLSFALALAEVVGASDIVIGVNAIDYSGYPDCRPEYVAAFEAMANLATKSGVEGTTIHIRTPLIDSRKADIIRSGLELDVDYGLTTSCYDPAPEGACGRCDACILRLQGFAQVGIEDPIAYRSGT
jgi:7-cyano-7-deazaguanine synthase